jgi:chlorobactene glucosyltransferase
MWGGAKYRPTSMQSVYLVIASTLLFLSGVAVTYLLHSRYRLKIVVTEHVAPLTGPAELISVIVPARNEARDIRRCVLALLAQTYPNYEIIVVDDRSGDETAAILATLEQDHPGRIQVVAGGDLPAGWAGKPHALHLGVQAAHGDWLCFVDADTFAAPDLMAAALTTAQAQQADLFTLLTDQELGSFWEKAILPLVFTALSFGFPAEKVNDPRRPEAIANGQFILIRRSVYTAVGGHAAIRDRIAEDKALAQLVKQHGYRLIVADGRQVASTRMYTRFAEIWEGWTKNIFLGMRDRPGLLFFGAFVGLVAALLLPLWLLGGLYWFLSAGTAGAALVAFQALALWAYLIYWRVRASLAFHISPLYAFTLPLGALLFTAMMFTSAFRVLSGQGVTWKGRTYTENG